MPMPTQDVTETMTRLKTLVGEMHDIHGAQGLLGWDLETCMPKAGAGMRAHQMETLAKLAHEKIMAPELAAVLKDARALAAEGRLEPLDTALVREFGRDYDQQIKLPAAFVQELSHTTSEAHPIWVEAREKKDFSLFAPILTRIIDLNRQQAEIYGYQDSPYDALLDLYEPDLTVKQLDALFPPLREELVTLIEKMKAATSPPTRDCLTRNFDVDKQWAFSEYLLGVIHFDTDAGRLDKAVHPFTSGSSHADVRLTTRIHEDDLFAGIGSTLHEGGHGLYEQGLDPALARTPLSGGTSLGMHESQSRLWENMVGRSKPFWQAQYPRLQAMFPEQLDKVNLDAFYRALNVVAPSFIRVEADEVTYNLHIIIRYEIERALIEGRMQAGDIPAAWNEKYTQYLGITPPDDGVGCLQDVHWSHGSFGYFPTYTLGNLYAAQIFNTIGLRQPDVLKAIPQGDLAPLRSWLKKEIHHVGRSETADTIARRVTGESLNSRYFADYLNRKYAGVYGL
ncbi:MAG: carboxypeptidase M32 [Candidatus Melainabacteria bacterium]